MKMLRPREFCYREHSPAAAPSPPFAPGGKIYEGFKELHILIDRLKTLVLYGLAYHADYTKIVHFMPLFLQRKEDPDETFVIIGELEEDPLLCHRNFKNLHSDETTIRPTADYMDSVQTQIDSKSRAVCVDLVIEAAEALHCTPSSVHHAVNYLDRYLSANNVEFANLIPIALTCLMIADKYNDDGFSFKAYTYLCEGVISGPEFVRMEADILLHLKYDLAVPTAHNFLERFLIAARCGREHPNPTRSLDIMANYLADISLLSSGMLSFPASVVAASSVFLAQYVVEPSQNPWSGTLRYYTMYEARDLKECVLALHEACGADEGCMTLKYSNKEYRDYVAWKSMSMLDGYLWEFLRIA